MKVAIVTGASQGIGAGLVTGSVGRDMRRRHLALDTPSDEPDYLTVAGDIADPRAAERVVEQALDRFGRIDTLINNAGVFIGKPFTDYTAEDYAAVTTVNPGQLLPHHTARDPADGSSGRRPCRQREHQPRRPRRQ